jgi:alkylhydroperoxidase family enzyme
MSMARLPLLPIEPADEVTAAVFETFRREGRDPIALYRALAHSPLMLRAYAGLAQGLRYEAQTPRALRELMILRTAQLTGSEYEWAHHRAMAAANDVPEEKVRALAAWRSSTLFDERERAALRSVDEIHDVALSDEAFAELERAMGAPATVELVLLTAFYEAVARIIQALGLEVEPAYQHFLGGVERDAAPAMPPPTKESEQ